MTSHKKNAAFVILDEEHKAINSNLQFFISRLEKLNPKKILLNEREELIFIFRYFHKRLAFHFDVEETMGILSDIRETAPELKKNVNGIIADHLDMLEQLDAIGKQLSAADLENASDLETLKREFNKFIDFLKKHEVKETSLVLKAANQELGTKD